MTLISVDFDLLGEEGQPGDQSLQEGFYFTVEAHNAVSQKKSHVASNISNEAVSVVNYILSPFLICPVCYSH